MPVYEFFWEERVLVEIEAGKELVEKLLNEYKSSNEYYNIEGFVGLLNKKGIKARILEPAHSLYF